MICLCKVNLFIKSNNYCKFWYDWIEFRDCRLVIVSLCLFQYVLVIIIIFDIVCVNALCSKKRCYLLIFIPSLWYVASYQQLQDYEQKLFGSSDSSNPALPTFSPAGVPSFNFGFSKANDPVPVPAFNNLGATSIFAPPPLGVSLHEFTFGAGQTQKSISESVANPSGSDFPMDST